MLDEILASASTVWSHVPHLNKYPSRTPATLLTYLSQKLYSLQKPRAKEADIYYYPGFFFFFVHLQVPNSEYDCSKTTIIGVYKLP